LSQLVYFEKDRATSETFFAGCSEIYNTFCFNDVNNVLKNIILHIIDI